METQGSHQLEKLPPVPTPERPPREFRISSQTRPEGEFANGSTEEPRERALKNAIREARNGDVVIVPDEAMLVTGQQYLQFLRSTVTADTAHIPRLGADKNITFRIETPSERDAQTDIGTYRIVDTQKPQEALDQMIQKARTDIFEL